MSDIIDIEELRKLATHLVATGQATLALLDRISLTPVNLVMVPAGASGPTFDQQMKTILQLVANHYSLDHDSMISRSREGHLVWGRHVACWIARKATGCSFHEIARTLNLTHGAVMNGFSRVTNRRDTEPATRQQTDDLLAAFLAAMKA